MRALVRDAVSDYDDRSMHGGMPVLPDIDAASKAVWDTVAGYGPLQQYFDDPAVEEIWVNEPSQVFVARNGVAELTTTLLTATSSETSSSGCSSPRGVGLTFLTVRGCRSPRRQPTPCRDPRHHPRTLVRQRAQGCGMETAEYSGGRSWSVLLMP